ncbi:ScbA/BarX family gamma-butyrolactone biosynthesis protein [Streptomyces sp. NPDC003042]
MSASTFHVKRPAIDEDLAWGATGAIPRPRGYRYATLTSTVPKELVHRASVAEVLLTDWQRVDDTRFALTAQWPRSHSFFTPIAGGFHDPMVCVETIRQIGSLLAHAEFDVPFGYHFLFQEFNLTVHPEHIRTRQTPASLDIEVTCTDIRRRGDVLAALRYEAVVRRDGELVATGEFAYTCVSPAVYRRVRPARVLEPGHRPLPLTAPAAPQSVGRLSPTDVVLSPLAGPNRWQLRVDTNHPILFDHPVDHVPGMMLIEAARQGAAAALGHSSFLPVSVASEFKRYAELDIPCVVEAHRLPRTAPGGEEAVYVTGHQNGEPVFSTTLTAAPQTG